jgi:hypothetical protein
MITFRIDPDYMPLRGQTYYAHEDYSFGFRVDPDEEVSQRVGEHGSFALCLGFVQLETSIDTLHGLYVIGYDPLIRVITRPLTPPQYTVGGIIINMDMTLYSGVGYELISNDELVTYVDKTSGWICFGRKGASLEGTGVMFVDNCICVIRDDQFASLWIHPQF